MLGDTPSPPCPPGPSILGGEGGRREGTPPNAAKLWVDYVLSREVQDVLAELDFEDSHLVEGSKTARELGQLRSAGVQLVGASGEFVLRQDAAAFGRRRTRI